jgi:hypothetical protein
MRGVTGLNPGEVKIFFSFHAAAMSLYYIIQRITKQKFCIFQKSFFHASLYGPTASGTGINPTSQVCLSAMLVLLIVGN